MTTRGIVHLWNDEEGWGVIHSPATPGGCWAHFSCVSVPGYRTLTPGSAVDFDWELFDQDGYAYRAVDVRPASMGSLFSGR